MKKTHISYMFCHQFSCYKLKKEAKKMTEKCLIMTSLAILVCHPSSTIRCFKPKPNSISPKKEKPHSKDNSNNNNSNNNNNHHQHQNLKPQEALDSHAKRVFSFPRLKEIRAPFELLEELVEGEYTLDMVKSIFRFGWKDSVGYKLQKVFRVNHGEEVYSRFEEYRKIVKSRRKRFETVSGDGNEVLRYRGTAVTCSLGFNQFSSSCNRKSCGVCRIIGCNSNSVEMSNRPISLSKTSWRAHRRVEKCGGGRDNNKRAIVVCRVIAGQVARFCNNGNIINGEGEEEEGDFDSVEYMDGSEKLLVLDSRAILPCFVVLYNVL